jgi:hypothetical protein
MSSLLDLINKHTVAAAPNPGQSKLDSFFGLEKRGTDKQQPESSRGGGILDLLSSQGSDTSISSAWKENSITNADIKLTNRMKVQEGRTGWRMGDDGNRTYSTYRGGQLVTGSGAEAMRLSMGDKNKGGKKKGVRGDSNSTGPFSTGRGRGRGRGGGGGGGGGGEDEEQEEGGGGKKEPVRELKRKSVLLSPSSSGTVQGMSTAGAGGAKKARKEGGGGEDKKMMKKTKKRAVQPSVAAATPQHVPAVVEDSTVTFVPQAYDGPASSSVNGGAVDDWGF